jgi:hypothetical protein
LYAVEQFQIASIATIREVSERGALANVFGLVKQRNIKTEALGFDISSEADYTDYINGPRSVRYRRTGGLAPSR